jgi:hypothetical protein
VVGYVESGNPANYTAVIAKAADAGCQLFMVFSGLDNNLRKQTRVSSRLNLVHMPGGVADRFEAWRRSPGMGLAAVMMCEPAGIWMVRQRPAVLTNLQIDQPVWCSTLRLTASVAKTIGQVGFDGVLNAVVDGAGLQVDLGHPEALFRSGRAGGRRLRCWRHKAR